MAKQESRTLKVHPHIIFDVIKRQAGTLSKALLEGVMNAIDAGGTRCDITLTPTKFTVSDDGKGFVSRQEIEDFFETFGTPHIEGEGGKQYGRFRIGRGQMMAFAVTKYRSGEFSMAVDIQGKGLDYDFHEGLADHKGCLIEGKLYHRLNATELHEIERSLKELVAYAPVPVTLNGEQINTLPQDVKWDIETDDAYFKFKANGDLKVYNMGVLVRSYYAAGVPSPPGIVVSKRALVVNFARNDVVESECPLWREAKKVLRKNADIERRTRAKLTDDIRQSIVRDLIAHVKSYDSLETRENKLVKVGSGRYAGLDSMLTCGMALTLAPAGSDVLADKIHAAEMAFVLRQETMEIFEVSTLEELRKKLYAIFSGSDWREYQISNLRFVDFSEFAAQFSDDLVTIPEKKLNKREKALLRAVRRMQDALYPRLNTAAGGTHGDAAFPKRKIFVGESDFAAGWTDGKHSIHIERKLLRRLVEGVSGAYLVVNTVVHEYSHADSSAGKTHLHDEAFMENYNLFMDRTDHAVSRAVEQLSVYVSAELRRIGVPPNKKLLKTLDIYMSSEMSESDIEEEETALERANLEHEAAIELAAEEQAGNGGSESSAMAARPTQNADRNGQLLIEV